MNASTFKPILRISIGFLLGLAVFIMVREPAVAAEGERVKPASVKINYIFPRDIQPAYIITQGDTSLITDGDRATGLHMEIPGGSPLYWRNGNLFVNVVMTFPEGSKLKGVVYDHRAVVQRVAVAHWLNVPATSVEYHVDWVKEIDGKRVAVTELFSDISSLPYIEVKSIRIEHSFSRAVMYNDTALAVLDIREIHGIRSEGSWEPRLTTPADGHSATVPPSVFTWEAAKSKRGVSSYTFELANNPFFVAPFVSQTVSFTEFPFNMHLPPGVYFWHVIARNVAGDTAESLPSASRFSILPRGCVYRPDAVASSVEQPPWPWNGVRFEYSGAISSMIDANPMTGYRISAYFPIDPKVDAIIHTDFNGAPTLTGIFYDHLYQLNRSQNPDPQNSIQMDIYARNPANQGRWEWLKVGNGGSFPPMIVKSARIRHTFTVWGWAEGGGTSILDVFEIRGINSMSCLPPEERLTAHTPRIPDTPTLYISKCAVSHPSRQISPISFDVPVIGITFFADTNTILNEIRTRTVSNGGRLHWIRRAALWQDMDGDGVRDRLLAQQIGTEEDGTTWFNGIGMLITRHVPAHLVITHDYLTDGRLPYDYMTSVLDVRVRPQQSLMQVTRIGLPANGDTLTLLKYPNQPPAAPRLAAPADGTESVPTTVELRVHPFVDPDGDTFGATQWQVSDSRGLFTNSSMVAGILKEGGDLETQFRIPRGLLKGKTLYTWRVRVSDYKGAWSPWSKHGSFVTAPEPLEYVYVHDTVYVDVIRNIYIDRYDTVYLDRHHYDTVFVDRPVDRVVIRYDTVYVDRTRYDTVYVDRPVERIVSRHDTIYVDRHHYDTVYVDRPVEHTVTHYDTIYVDRHHYDTVYVDRVVVRYDTVYVDRRTDDDESDKSQGNNGLGNGGEESQGEDPTRGQDPSNPGRRPITSDERLQFSIVDAAGGTIRLAGAVDYAEEVSEEGRKQYPISKFRYGLFTYNLEGVPVGGPTTLRIAFPEDVPAGAKYMLWNPASGWMDLTPQLGSMDGDNTVELTLFDGGPGDLDGIANGTIVDPGGFVFPETEGGSSSTVSTVTRKSSMACAISRVAPGLDLSAFRSLRDVILEFERGRTLVKSYYRFCSGQ